MTVSRKKSKALKAPAPDAPAPGSAFWMPMKVGLFVGLLFSTLNYAPWHLRRMFLRPEDVLGYAILKMADLFLLVVFPVLAGMLMGYLLHRNQATTSQSLAATVLTGLLIQVVLQLGETAHLAFFAIPTVVMLVSMLVSKIALAGFRT